MTRKEKRKHEKDRNYFFEFAKTKRHFFQDLPTRLKQVQDVRHESYITYSPDVLLFMMIMKNACDIKAMRAMTHQLNREEAIHNMQKVLDIKELDELPHYDTINDFLKNLEPTELEAIRTHMIKKLFQKRCFDHHRINGKYWGVIVDGTGLFHFSKRHCEHCLRREWKNEETGEKQVVYMHHVLEAKLVVGNMVLSIGSEFIENESEDVSKQDCELKAFHRLAAKIKKDFPRLPICVLGDSLYACESVFRRCEGYKWKYIMRFKEKRIKSITEEFRALQTMETNGIERIEARTDEREVHVCWVNDIFYKGQNIHVLEGKETKKQTEEKTFLFLMNIPIDKRHAQALFQAGRSRWKIENEGFNVQKNQRYYIEHAGCKDYQAMKNHYLLAQITDIVMQVYEKGCRVLKDWKKTTKEISSDLLDAIRSRKVTDEDILTINKPMQARFT